MANTYTQIHIHFVFAVKLRRNFIRPEIREQLEKFIYAMAEEKKCKPMAVYCNPDHVHLLVGLSPDVSCSELMQHVKAHSSRIMKTNLNSPSFEWQKGFGAFSVSKKDEKNVIRYILDQEEHHKKRGFKEEYLDLLEDNMIDFRKEFMFEFYTE